MDEIPARVGQVVEPLRLVRLAVGVVRLLLEAAHVGRAPVDVDHVPALREGRVHRVDPVAHKRVSARRMHREARVAQHLEVRHRRVVRLAAIARAVRVDVDRMPRVAAAQHAAHVRRVVGLRHLGHCARLAGASHVDHRAHVADVEVHADVQRLALALHLVGAVLRPVEAHVDRAARQVHEAALEVRLQQVLRVDRAQAVDVVLGQVRIARRRRAHQLIAGPGILLPRLVDEAEPLRRRCHRHRVRRPVRLLLAVPRQHPPPHLGRIVALQRVELVDVAVGDLVADYPARRVHAAKHDAPVPGDLQHVDRVLRQLVRDPEVRQHLLEARPRDHADQVVGRLVERPVELRIADFAQDRPDDQRLRLAAAKATHEGRVLRLVEDEPILRNGRVKLHAAG